MCPKYKFLTNEQKHTREAKCRVFIRSRVPGTGTRLLWTEYPATYSAKLKKKKNSNKKIINLN